MVADASGGLHRLEVGFPAIDRETGLRWNIWISIQMWSHVALAGVFYTYPKRPKPRSWHTYRLGAIAVFLLLVILVWFT